MKTELKCDVMLPVECYDDNPYECWSLQQQYVGIDEQMLRQKQRDCPWVPDGECHCSCHEGWEDREEAE